VSGQSQLVESISMALQAVQDRQQCLSDDLRGLTAHINTLLRENSVLRASMFPDGEEMSSPLALILRCVRNWYGRGYEIDHEFWGPHLVAMDAIIARVDGGGTVGRDDIEELGWWSEGVNLSSKVMPNAVTFAFIDVMQKLRVEAERETPRGDGRDVDYAAAL